MFWFYSNWILAKPWAKCLSLIVFGHDFKIQNVFFLFFFLLLLIKQNLDLLHLLPKFNNLLNSCLVVLTPLLSLSP
jgi:hypothetical protein